MKQRYLIILLFVLGLSGCYSWHINTRTVSSRVVKDNVVATIYRDTKSKSSYIQIDKVMNSKCLCADVIAERYINHRVVYRLYYGCSIYKTRKEMYGYCSRGALIKWKIFDGSEEAGDSYETRLDATDKFVLHKIDSFIQTESERVARYKLCRRIIRGFQRAKLDSINTQ